MPLFIRVLIALFFYCLLGGWVPRGTPSAVPVVTASTFYSYSPASTSQAVGTVSATNSPTGFAITGGNSAGDFAISSSGAITVTAQGQTDLNGSTAAVSFTLTVTASNGSGTSFGASIPITVYADGFAAASNGTAPLPTILNGYHSSGGSSGRAKGNGFQPPWNVAGVDYEVGVPASATLSSPTTITNTGCSVNSGSHQVTCTGSSVGTITNIDFSLNGGWQLILSCTNCTVTNSNFAIGANAQPMINANVSGTNKTITHSTLNANSTNDGLNQTNIDISGGTTTLEYNLIENACADLLDIEGSGAQTYIIKYNLLTNAGGCAGAHPDWLQQGGATYSNNVVAFNTWYQSVKGAAGGTQGVGMDNGNNSAVVNGANQFINNTVISLSGVSMNYQLSALIQTGVSASFSVDSNYYDHTGSAAVYKNYSTTLGTTPPTSYTNNVNMVTGTSQNTN